MTDLSAPPSHPVVWEVWTTRNPSKRVRVTAQTAYDAWRLAIVELPESTSFSDCQYRVVG